VIEDGKITLSFKAFEIKTIMLYMQNYLAP
jgi:hypothetical protein